MKFSFLTVKIVFFLLLFFFLGCSEEAEDLTPKDEIPPTVTSVNISEGEEIEPPFEIVVNFNENINQNSLYGIKISGLSAGVEAAGSAILVKIPEGAKPGRYTLVISGVEDLGGNTMGMATTISFLIPSPPPPKEETPQREEPEPPRQPEEPEEPEQVLIETVKPIADGIFIIAAGDFQAFRFEVTDDMFLPFEAFAAGIVEGEFEVLAGVDVEVFIFDEINFKNWKANVAGVRVWFQSGRVAAGKIEEVLLPGTYYLVLNNRFSIIARKNVQIKAELRFFK